MMRYWLDLQSPSVLLYDRLLTRAHEETGKVLVVPKRCQTASALCHLDRCGELDW